MPKSESFVEPDDLVGRASYLVRLIQIAAYKNFESRMKGFGSAPRYYGLMRIVQANPGILQSRLAETICLDRSSLVPILDTLSKEGLLERHPSTDDKRVRCVFLTETGAALLQDMSALVDEHEAKMVEGLSDEERDTLVELLLKVSKNLRPEVSSTGVVAK